MATTSEASRLQKAGYVMRFKLITVGLLALLGLTACGVGVNDPAGVQAAYGTAGQALIGLDGQPVVNPAEAETPMTAPGGPVDPSISSLPTDPVPLHNPTPGAATVDPMVAPMQVELPPVAQ
jgi:hypothetical protein